MNKVIIVGNFTRDPELKQTNSGKSVVNFTLAVDRRRTNKDGNREADFINCVAFEGTAQFISNYFSRGKKIGITGRLQSRSYDAQDGSKRNVTEVVVEDAEFVERAERQNEAPRQEAPQMNNYTNSEMVEASDDELPF